ncbi:MAG TPA: molybdopterin molybdenumtransferase MoeA [Arcobacter sp.]|nr:molybdopterin molybdenumtransferase MoeA [Arcobacter sp.]
MACDIKRGFISYDKSIQILNDIKLQNKKTKKLFLTDAIGFTLASHIIASSSSPEFPTSAMDGYAVRHEDLALGKLNIIDYNPAGSEISTEVSKSNCIKTFTGSLMPKSSDTLIPIENVTVKDETIIINETVPFGFATRKIGENYTKDEVLIKAGTKISFSEIGVMASLNIVQVEVYVKAIVSIASTGSEILDLGEEQTNNSQIRSSNHLTLESIAKQYGAEVHQKGVVKDDRTSILNLIKSSLENSDIVVTTGGVSVGDYDFVKDIIKDEIGAKVLYQGVNIKPGQHIIIAQKDDKFIVGLPGFAYSSTVTFLLYVLPLIFKFNGADESLVFLDAILEENFPKKTNKTVFTACNINLKDGKYYANFDGKKSGTSAILTNMIGNVALIMQDENSSDVKSGEIVKVLMV